MSAQLDELKRELRRVKRKRSFELWNYAEKGEIPAAALAIHYVETGVVEVAKDYLQRVPDWALELVRERLVRPASGRGVMSVSKVRMVDVAIRKRDGKLRTKDTKKPRAGVCRKCGCTEEAACIVTGVGPCSWTDRTRTLCTACVPAKATRAAVGVRMERGGA